MATSAVESGKPVKLSIISPEKRLTRSERVIPVRRRKEKEDLNSSSSFPSFLALTYEGSKAGDVDSLKKSKIRIKMAKEKKYASEIEDAPKR